MARLVVIYKKYFGRLSVLELGLKRGENLEILVEPRGIEPLTS
jgi:hypothetical protein